MSKHVFQKCAVAEKDFYCHMCQNQWVENGVGVSKFYSCSTCVVGVHASCRQMAMKCYACNVSQVEHAKKSREELGVRPLQTGGHFSIRVLNAYDLDPSVVPIGSYLYGILSIPTEEGVIRTVTACKSETDCVWPGGETGGFDAEASMLTLTPVTPSLLTSLAMSLKSVNPQQQALSLPPPMLRVELWRSAMFVFDSLAASTEVSLLPMLQYPGAIVERWFGLVGPTGNRCGAVLLRLQFNSSTGSAPAEGGGEALVCEAVEPDEAAATTAAIAAPNTTVDPSISAAATTNTTNTTTVAAQSPTHQRARPRAPLTPGVAPKVATSATSAIAAAVATNTASSSLASPEPIKTPIAIQRELPAPAPVPVPVPVPVSASAVPSTRASSATVLSSDIRSRTASANSTSSSAAEDAHGQGRRGSAGGGATIVATAPAAAAPAPVTQTINRDRQTQPQAQPQTQIQPQTKPQPQPQPQPQQKQQSLPSPQKAVAPLATPERDRKDSAAATGVVVPTLVGGGLGVGAAGGSGQRDQRRLKQKEKRLPSAAQKPLPLNAPLSPRMAWAWAVGLGQRAQQGLESLLYEDKAAMAGGAGARGGGRGGSSGSFDEGEGSSTEASPLPSLNDLALQRSRRPLKAGVGRFYVHLVSVLRSEVSDAAEGSHYVELSIEDLPETRRRTQTVHGSAAPVYRKNFQFVAPHYRSVLKVALVDALTGRMIGQSKISAYSVLQRDADLHRGDWRQACLEKVVMRDPANADRVGHVTLRVAFEEDVGGLFKGPRPRSVAAEAPEQWSVERFQTHLARFKYLIAVVMDWHSAYSKIMAWENKMLTGTLFVLFVWAALRMDAEYALCCPLFLLAAALTMSLRRRKNGQYKEYWVSRGARSTTNEQPRSTAVLRVAVLGFRNLPDGMGGSSAGHAGGGSSAGGAGAGGAGSGSSGGAAIGGMSSSGFHGLASSLLASFSSDAGVDTTDASAARAIASAGIVSSRNTNSNSSSGNSSAATPLSGPRPFVRISYVPVPEVASATDKDIREYFLGEVGGQGEHGRGSGGSGTGALGGMSTASVLSSYLQALPVLGAAAAAGGMGIAAVSHGHYRDGMLHNTLDSWGVTRGSARDQLTEAVRCAMALGGGGHGQGSQLGESARIVDYLLEEAAASAPSPSTSSATPVKDKSKEKEKRGSSSYGPFKEDLAFVYPVVQPLRVVLPPAIAKVTHNASDSEDENNSGDEAGESVAAGADGANANEGGSKLLSWSRNPSFLKMSLFHLDPSASMASLVVDPTLGVVRIRLSDIVAMMAADASGVAYTAGRLAEEEHHGDNSHRSSSSSSSATPTSWSDLGLQGLPAGGGELCRWFDVTPARASGLASTAQDFQSSGASGAAADENDQSGAAAASLTSGSLPALAANDHRARAAAGLRVGSGSGSGSGSSEDEEEDEETSSSLALPPQVLLRISLAPHDVISTGHSVVAEKKKKPQLIAGAGSGAGSGAGVSTGTPPAPEALVMAVQASLSEAGGGGASWVSTIWNTTGYLEYVSNLMAWLLDSLESFKNLFNWSVPSKTYPLYVGVLSLLVLTMLVPGRYLILAVGLHQFFAAFMPKGSGESPMSVRLCNLLHAVPNDDDLDKVYQFERKEYSDSLQLTRAEIVRHAKKNIALACIWEGSVRMKVASGGGLRDTRAAEWLDVYLLLQNHRLVWWAREADIDEGKAALGQLLLFGHAGTTAVSHVEINQIGDDSRLVSIFGRDAAGRQLKCTVLCGDMSSCQLLRQRVESAVTK